MNDIFISQYTRKHKDGLGYSSAYKVDIYVHSYTPIVIDCKKHEVYSLKLKYVAAKHSKYCKILIGMYSSSKFVGYLHSVVQSEFCM